MHLLKKVCKVYMAIHNLIDLAKDPKMKIILHNQFATTQWVDVPTKGPVEAVVSTETIIPLYERALSSQIAERQGPYASATDVAESVQARIAKLRNTIGGQTWAHKVLSHYEYNSQSKTFRTYNNAQVHCESALLLAIVQKCLPSCGYISPSKWCCYACHTLIRVWNSVIKQLRHRRQQGSLPQPLSPVLQYMLSTACPYSVPRCHEKGYPLWLFPTFPPEVDALIATTYANLIWYDIGTLVYHSIEQGYPGSDSGSDS